MFFIGFPHAITSIGQTKLYAKPVQSIFSIKLYTDLNKRFSFKVRQHGNQKLYLQYKLLGILYKIVGALSFLQS